MNRNVWMALLLAVWALPAVARVESGVSFPEQFTSEGKTLKLSGAGLRKRFVFKVYVAGLYAEQPSSDAAGFISSDQTKKIILSMVRDLDRKQIFDAIREGFERNSKAAMPSLQVRLNQLAEAIPDLRYGDRITLTYVPQSGTRVEVNEKQRALIEGKDFADALFAVWLGQSPVDDWLKSKLLGAK